MVIPCNQLGGIRSLTAILTDPVRYATDHGGKNSFSRPTRLPLEDASIDNDASTVIRVKVEAVHKSRRDNFASYEAAERSVAKFLRDTVEEIWYNNLKDADSFYRVTAWEIMELLDVNSGGLYSMVQTTNMHQNYTQADVIPQFISMMEDAQKKAKRVGMPIADVELVMVASTAVFAAQHFPREVDDWEGLASSAQTWTAWKTAFRLAHM